MAPIRLIAPHQVEGVEWLVRREMSDRCPGGLLCDEMGLGKTVQILETMVRNFKNRTLIVVPKSIVGQWVEQIHKFVPSFTVCTYDGPNRAFFWSDVCVCPYSLVADLTWIKWDRVILDEGHEIRNRKSLVNRTCSSVQAPIRWIITGTPVFNKMRDFINLCEFVGISRGHVQRHLDDVKKEFVLRRTKVSKGGGIDFTLVELDMYDDEQAFYEQVQDESFSCVLERILRCRQASSWPPMYEGPRISKKLDTLEELVAEHPTEKSLVFTQFRDESREIQRRFAPNSFRLDGTTEDRDSVISQFKAAPPGAVFVIQIKTGGVGLNLQEATRVYITQPSWNPATELQAIARAYRNGQERKVYIKKLLYTGVDLEIANLQYKKSAVSKQVVGAELEIPRSEKISNFGITLGKGIVDEDEEEPPPSGITAENGCQYEAGC